MALRVRQSQQEWFDSWTITRNLRAFLRQMRTATFTALNAGCNHQGLPWKISTNRYNRRRSAPGPPRMQWQPRWKRSKIWPPRLRLRTPWVMALTSQLVILPDGCAALADIATARATSSAPCAECQWNPA